VLPPFWKNDYLMKQLILYALISMSAIFILGCTATSKRKSENYYYQNKDQITEILKLYERLYTHQPFSAGYSDKSYKYVTMEVITDTVRYVFNNKGDSKTKLFETIRKFDYDTAMLKELSERLKTIKALWLSKAIFNVNGKKEAVTFLSFKSVLVEKPFVENKYYILLFPPHAVNNPEAKAKIQKGDIVMINDSVYFMIGSKFK
jgi:hypothetical protein